MGMGYIEGTTSSGGMESSMARWIFGDEGVGRVELLILWGLEMIVNFGKSLTGV